MSPSDPPPFRWTRELPALALAVAPCLAVRLLAAPLGFGTLNGDAAVHLLMAKHFAQGQLPLMFYGQGYVGSLEALCAAPFYAVLGADLRGMGYAQALIAAVLVVLMYRLAWRLGGRIAALAASIPFGLGTQLALANTAGQYGSYPTTQALGLGVWLAALPLLERPGAPGALRRLGLAALLAGVGAWNNPQISGLLAPLLALAYLHGRTARAWREGRLAAALGRAWLPARAAVAVALLAIALCAAGALAVAQLDDRVVLRDGTEVRGRRIKIDDGRVHLRLNGQTRAIPHSDIAVGGLQPAGTFVVGGLTLRFTRPHHYLVRAVAALIGLLAAIELVLAGLGPPTRRALGVAGACFALGFLPQLGFAATRDRSEPIKSPPIGLDPAMALGHARTLPGHLGLALFNPPEPSAPLPFAPDAGARAYRLTRSAVIALSGLALLLALWRGRRALAAIARGRPPSAQLPALLGLHAAALLALYLGFPQAGNDARYLHALWIPLAGLLGWVAARAWRLQPIAGAAVLVLLTTGYAVGQAHNLVRMRQDCTTRVAHDRAFAEQARRRGLTAGYANFWTGYMATYRSDEALALATLPPVGGTRYQLAHYTPYHRRAERSPRRLWIFEPDQQHIDRQVQRRVLEGETGDRIRERWHSGPPRPEGGSGPFVLYETRR